MNQPTAKRFLLLALAFGLTAGTLSLARPDAPALSEATEAVHGADHGAGATVPLAGPADPTRRVVAAGKTIDGFYHAPIGTRLDYTMQCTTETSIGAASARARQTLAFELTGTARLVVVDRRPGEAIIAWSWPQIDVVARGADGRKQVDPTGRAKRALARTTLVRMTNAGAIVGYRFDAAVDQDTERWVRTMTAAARHVVEADTGSYEVVEYDTTGAARIGYRWKRPALGADGADAIGELHKQKIAYEEHKCDIQSKGVAKMDRRLGAVREASYRETLRFLLADVQTRVEHAFRFDMRLTATGTDRTFAESIDWERNWKPTAFIADTEQSVAEFEARMFRRELGDAKITDLLAEIQALLAAAPIDRQALFMAREKLSWLLRFDATALDDLAHEIRQSQNQRAYSNVLLAAAGAAQTEPAQALLGQILNDRQMNERARLGSAFSMFQVRKPTAALLNAVRQASRPGQSDVGDTSLLALGDLSGRATGSAGKDAVEALLALESTAREQGRLSTWLLALGNNGDARVAARARAYLKHADPVIRIATAKALRGQIDAASLEGLLGLALGDSNRDVRATGLGVLAARGDAVGIQVVGEALENEPSPLVRKSAVKNLGRHRGNPAVTKILRRTVEKDADPSVQEMAKRILHAKV